MEIYNERIYDLLNSAVFRSKKGQAQTSTFGGSNQDPMGLKLKWNDSGHFTVDNLF
jgi:hypothetical protein